MHGANRTGRPFTGDYAGVLLYKTLHKFGFSTGPESAAADDDLQLIDCRITNAVKCLPPDNKPVGAEINTCNTFLANELATLADGAVVLALHTAGARNRKLILIGNFLSVYQLHSITPSVWKGSPWMRGVDVELDDRAR